MFPAQIRKEIVAAATRRHIKYFKQVFVYCFSSAHTLTRAVDYGSFYSMIILDRCLNIAIERYHHMRIVAVAFTLSAATSSVVQSVLR